MDVEGTLEEGAECELKTLKLSQYYQSKSNLPKKRRKGQKSKESKKSKKSPHRHCSVCGSDAYFYCAAHSSDYKASDKRQSSFVVLCGPSSKRGSTCFVQHVSKCNMETNDVDESFVCVAKNKRRRS